jgi:hypothetical protein
MSLQVSNGLFSAELPAVDFINYYTITRLGRPKPNAEGLPKYSTVKQLQKQDNFFEESCVLGCEYM